MSTVPPLVGTRVWVTRSQPGAAELADALQAVGCEPVVEPVLSIETFEQPIRLTALDGVPADSEPTEPDLIIALSAHAVRPYLASEFFKPGCAHIAVGAGTATQLQSAGVSTLYSASPASSEGIVQLPALQTLGAGNQVWIMAGEGGRETVARYLAGRHVAATKFVWYQRRARSVPAQQLRKLDAILVASVFGMQRIAELGTPTDVGLVVASQRIATAARAMGYHRLVVADDAGVQAMTDSLLSLLEGAA